MSGFLNIFLAQDPSPTLVLPAPPSATRVLAFADVPFSVASPIVSTEQWVWASSTDIATWTPTVSLDPIGSPKRKYGGVLATDGRSVGNVYDMGFDGNGRWVAVGDPSVGGVWGSPQFGSTSNVDGSIATSDDGGVTWVRRTPALPNSGSPRPLEPFYGVAYNGTIWVAVSFDADSVSTLSEIWTSTDNATTWSRGYSPTSQNLNDVEWTGDEFVIVGDNHTLLTSTDGLTWTEVQPGSPLPFENFLTDYTSFDVNPAGPGSPNTATRWFIGTGTSGSPIFSGNIWYSDDKGVTWNRGVGVGSPGSETGFSSTVYDIAVNRNNDTVIGVGFTDEVLVSNDNGLTFRTVQLDGAGSPFRDPSIYCAEWDPLYGFLIGGTEAWYFKPLLMSGGQDGLSWEARIGVGAPDFNEVWGSPFLGSATIQAIGVYGSPVVLPPGPPSVTAFVASMEQSTNGNAYYSADGINWTQTDVDTNPTMGTCDVIYAKVGSPGVDGWIIFGDNSSEVYTSTDGITWSAAGASGYAVSVAHAYSDTLDLIAAQRGNSVADTVQSRTSSDGGANFTQQTDVSYTPNNPTPTTLRWIPERQSFVSSISVTGNTFTASNNGINWTKWGPSGFGGQGPIAWSGTLGSPSILVYHYLLTASWGYNYLTGSPITTSSWTTLGDGVSSGMRAMTYGQSMFVGAGDDGIHTWDGNLAGSPQHNWITRLSGVSFSDICYHPTLDIFVAVGDDAGDAVIYSSSDGVTWTERVKNLTEGGGIGFVTVAPSNYIK